MHEDNKEFVNSGRFSIFMDAQAMGFFIVYRLWFDVQSTTTLTSNSKLIKSPGPEWLDIHARALFIYNLLHQFARAGAKAQA